jgi:hypothetical protein
MAERDPVDNIHYRMDSPPKGKAKQVFKVMLPVSFIIKIFKYLRKKL